MTSSRGEKVETNIKVKCGNAKKKSQPKLFEDRAFRTVKFHTHQHNQVYDVAIALLPKDGDSTNL